MAMLSETDQKIPLGVGRILSDGFSILFGNFFKVLVIGLVPILLAVVLTSLSLDSSVFDVILFSAYGHLAVLLLEPMFLMIAMGVTTALVVQLAYDAKLGRRNALTTYIRAAIPAIVPITVLTIAVTVLAYIGALALLIGMVWVYAVFSVMAPAAVIERAGLGAMRRSAVLTKEYRWPIVGAFLVVGIINTVLSKVVEFLQYYEHLALPAGLVGEIAYGVVMLAIISLGFAYSGIVSALVYARLREIKDGLDIYQLAAVFD